MHKIVNAIRASTFLKHNAIFFFGAVAAGALNYAFYPVLARLLSTSNFGEVQALCSLFAQVNIFLGVLGLLTVNIVANTKQSGERDRIIIELEKLALLIGALLVVATLIMGSSLKHFFHFTSAWPFVWLAAAVLVSVPLMFRNSFLRGRQAFGLTSILGVIAAGVDLLLAVVSVLLHLQTTGVMVALVVAQFLTFIYSSWLARRRGFSGRWHETLLKLPDMRVITPELGYATVVLVSSLTITGLYSIDTIVVKHWFDAHTAGLYAGIATVARIIFFVTASIAQVLLPSVRMNQSAKSNQQVLTKSLILLVSIGGGVLLLFMLLPKLVMETLMGQRFLPYASLLPRLSIVIFLISVINLFMLYHLALRRYAVVLIAVCGAVVTTALFAMHHHSLAAIINDLLCSCTLVAVLLGVWSITVRPVSVPMPDLDEA
ncbi:MAG TPA: oligosaccharide flippase family protein [Candidatus Saccharimonadia bacterium]|nr:oligosaccharide flippase family protein [Candidatus Saccharimonadia bacterium]